MGAMAKIAATGMVPPAIDSIHSTSSIAAARSQSACTKTTLEGGLPAASLASSRGPWAAEIAGTLASQG
jgi:hypothetical protein